MKNQTSILAFFKKIIFPVTVLAMLASCNRDDDKEKDVPQYYFSTTTYYGAKTDSTQVRADAVGKWYDSNNKLILNIQKGYKNPDFPFVIEDGIKIWQSYYAYDITSTVEGYSFDKTNKTPEFSRFDNNINLGGMFHLIVEGNSGYIWVMRNQPYIIKVTKQ